MTVSGDGVSFSSVGLACGTGCSAEQLADVTAQSLYLLSVDLRAAVGTPAGTYGGGSLGLRPYSFEVTNYGGGYILDKVSGSVYDARDTAADEGQLVIAAIADVGLFAYPLSSSSVSARPQAVLFNSAPMTGATVSYPIAAVAVSDYDLASSGASVLTDVSSSSDLSCAITALPQSVLASHADCSLVMGVEQTAGASGLIVEVSFGSGAPLGVEVPLSVYAISVLTIQAPTAAAHGQWS